MCMCACVAVLINFADGSAGNKRNTSDNLSYTKVLSVASIGTVTGVGGRPEKKKKSCSSSSVVWVSSEPGLACCREPNLPFSFLFSHQLLANATFTLFRFKTSQN